MKNLLVLVLSVVLLSGCTPETKDVSDSWVMPPDLQGCKVYSLSNDTGSTMKVLACPDTYGVTTSERQGKVDVNTTTIYRKGV